MSEVARRIGRGLILQIGLHRRVGSGKNMDIVLVCAVEFNGVWLHVERSHLTQ